MAMPRSLGSSQVTLRSPIQIWPVSTSSRPAIALSKRRLAAAGGAEQDQELALLDVEREAVEHPHRLEGDRDVANGDCTHGSQPLTAPAAMPRTNQRPETKYTTSGTSAVSMVAAMSTL